MRARSVETNAAYAALFADHVLLPGPNEGGGWPDAELSGRKSWAHPGPAAGHDAGWHNAAWPPRLGFRSSAPLGAG